MRDCSRREFLEVSAAAAALGVFGWPQSANAQTADGWNQGQLTHLIPTASHERFLIKASFKSPLTSTPRLTVNGKPIEGEKTDTQGRFWRFDAPLLLPATQSTRRTSPSSRASATTKSPGFTGRRCDPHQPSSSRTTTICSRTTNSMPVSRPCRRIRMAWSAPSRRSACIIRSSTLGTGDMAFPSAVRSVESKPSQLVGMDEALKPTEKNGFAIIDVTPDKMTFTQFMWRPPQPVGEIDTMKPRSSMKCDAKPEARREVRSNHAAERI